jgi:hypothetical protein
MQSDLEVAMDEFPRFGQELADAQAQLDEVLARCAIRLKAFDGVAAANDNALFPGRSAQSGNSTVATPSPEGCEIAG